MEPVFRVTDKTEELKELKLLAKRLTRENIDLQLVIDQKMWRAFVIDASIFGLIGFVAGAFIVLTFL